MSLSVVVVNYNNSRFLRKALDSVVTQSLQPAEVVVADDCSTDDSCAIVAEYMSRHPFVTLIRNARNLGPAGNRDAGIRACTSSHFVTLDSDDWFESGALEAIDRRLRADGQKKIVISSFRVVRDETTPLFTIDTSSYCSPQLESVSSRVISSPWRPTYTDFWAVCGCLCVSMRIGSLSCARR